LKILLGYENNISDTLVLHVSYSAQPNAGMYFQRDPQYKDAFYCYTYGEGGLHANWLPIYNDVNDKFSSEMVVTVPSGYTVISNGKLIDRSTVQPDFQRFHWLQELPHSNYLIALYIGKFDSVSLRSARGKIPVNAWFPKGRESEARYVLKNTTDMIEFFSNLIGYPYPWNKYDQIIIPDYAPGGMEHTSVTGLRASILRTIPEPVSASPNLERYHEIWTNEGLISHELAHMWFGDLVTCRSLNHIWLNESFATYLQFVWEGKYYGREMFDLDRNEAMDHYLNYVRKTHLIRPLEYDRYDAIGEIYNNEHVYFKGSLILNMLKGILGEENFYRVCSYYLHQHQFKNVESNDLKIAIEEVTGRNLDWFFKDWVYGAGHPVFEVGYQYLPDKKVIDLSIKQIQPHVEGQDLFTLPVEITIGMAKTSHTDTVWVEQRSQQFMLPCSEKPELVSFDGGGQLVAEVNFPKSLKELIYQSRFDRLPGRIRALRQMADNYPANVEAVQAFNDIMKEDNFWGIQAEAASRLGSFHISEAEPVLLQALKAKNFHVRKAAALALPGFRVDFAEKTLWRVIEQEKENDVVATAIVALAKVNPQKNISFLRQQLQKDSWYNEIKIACMQAFEIIGDSSLVNEIKPYCHYPHHQHLIGAALSAWVSCAPNDEQLHRLLMQYVFDAANSIQYQAVELLGSLNVRESIPVLEKVYNTSGDRDLRIAAATALEQIKRFEK